MLHEEAPVVEKNVVPKERVRLDKDTVTDEERSPRTSATSRSRPTATSTADRPLERCHGRHRATNDKGVSLAKGPVGIIGLLLLAYGVTALIFGGHSFTTHPVDGTVNGKTWLGLEVNAWSSLLFIAAGALLLFGSPLHWAAKSMSLIVGLVLGAASVISLVDGEDVFGIFAANGLTKLVWGVAAAVLIVLSLLPRVGGGRKDRDEHVEPATRPVAQRPVPREGSGRFDGDTANREQTGARSASSRGGR